MRQIDADYLIERLNKLDTMKGIGLEPVMAMRDVKALISMMPTVDAVPVIRCKDCITWDTDWTTHPPDHYCPAIDQFTSADFYCGYSEKLEGQDDE